MGSAARMQGNGGFKQVAMNGNNRQLRRLQHRLAVLRRFFIQALNEMDAELAAMVEPEGPADQGRWKAELRELIDHAKEDPRC